MKFIDAKSPLQFQVTITPDLLYPLYVRGKVAVTCGAPGTDKTSLMLAEALAMASGEPLLGVRPSGKFRVWVQSHDETEDQARLRLNAIAKRNDLPANAASSVYVTSGTLFGGEIERAIREHQFDCCIILDSHSGRLDDLAGIADATDCAIHVTDAPRGDRTLRRMTFAESRAAEIPDGERAHHFMAVPDRTIYRIEPMDGIGVVVTKDRAAFCRDDNRRIRVIDGLAMSDDDGPWRADRRSPQWLGLVVAREFGLDVRDAVVRRQIQEAIVGWCQTGVLERYNEFDVEGHRRTFLRPPSAADRTSNDR
jgi:hypothetical protein